MPALADDAARVVDEVEHHLLQPVHVAENQRRPTVDGQRHVAVLQQRLEHRRRAVGGEPQVDLRQRQLAGRALDALEREQVVGEPAQPLGLERDRREEALLVLGVDVAVEQRLGGAADGGERRAQLVAHVRDELRLAPLLDLELVDRRVDLGRHLVERLGDDARLARALDLGADAVVARGERCRRRAEPLERRHERVRDHAADEPAEHAR